METFVPTFLIINVRNMYHIGAIQNWNNLSLLFNDFILFIFFMLFYYLIRNLSRRGFVILVVRVLCRIFSIKQEIGLHLLGCLLNKNTELLIL